MCVRLESLIRSLTSNQKVLGSIPGLVEGRTLADLWFFRHTVHGQECEAVGLVSQCSVEELKRSHTLLDMSKLVLVLWTVFPASEAFRSGLT